MDFLLSSVASETNLSVPSALKEVILAIPAMSVVQRKFMLDLCRIQHFDIEWGPFLHLLPNDTSYPHQPKHPVASFSVVVHEHMPKCFKFPIFLSIISAFLRCLPLDEGEAQDQILQAYSKEILASQTTRPVAPLDHFGLINPRWSKISRGRGQVGTRNKFWVKLRSSFCTDRGLERLYFPHYGRKLLARETQDRMEHLGGAATPESLILHYHQTGEQIGGRAEMKHAYRYGELKPRVYYAQGGDGFWSGCHLRDILYRMLEFSASTARGRRTDVFSVLPSIGKSSKVFIYDFTSFTTNLSEIGDFTHALGVCCLGVKYRYLDVREGIVVRDLGEDLLEYQDRELCNVQYLTPKYLGGDEGVQQYFEQRNGGMLGIQGNISLSMLLHGLWLTSLVGDERSCIVAGDDALAVTETFPSWNAISTIGSVALDKTYTWFRPQPIDDGSYVWKYLKRPLRAFPLEAGQLINFPNLALLSSYTDKFHSTLGDPIDRMESFFNQTTALFDSLSPVYELMSSRDIEVLLSFLRYSFRCLRVNTNRGYLPGCLVVTGQDRPVSSAVPLLCAESIVHWDVVLWRECPDMFLRMPELERSLPPVRFTHVGQVFEATAHKSLRLLEVLGYMEKEGTAMWWPRSEESRRSFRSFILGDLKPVYRCTFLREPPAWWDSLLDVFSPVSLESVSSSVPPYLLDCLMDF